MQVEHIALLPALAAGILSIATATGVILNKYANAYAALNNVTNRGLNACEVLVASSLLGVHTTYDADAHAKNMALVNAAVVDKILYRVTDAVKALTTVGKLKGVVLLLLDNIILQVGNHAGHTVTTHIYARKVNRRVSKSKDIGATTTRSLHLAKVSNNTLIAELLHELGYRWHADSQLLSKLSKSALAIDSHIGDNVTLDYVVLLKQTLILSLMIVEEIY